jgi:glyoxylase-like metal-dependent hydrolase (beta-lactamase superfamily II)
MRIECTGKIAEDFYVLGHSAVPVYLMDGPVPVLFDAGFTGFFHHYERSVRDILGSRSPGFLFLTHAHWDHVGAVSHLKKLWPEMKIAGAQASERILKRSGALERIEILNREVLEVLSSWGVPNIFEKPFEPFAFDMVFEPGQIIEIHKGLTLETIAAPGHTWDSTAYWIPEKKILVAGEAAGCDEVCQFLVDHEAYRNSMVKLAGLDAEILCTAHKLVVTGSDVPEYIDETLSELDEYVHQVKRYLKEENNNLERVVARVKALDWDPKPLPKQPLNAYLMNARTRVKTIIEKVAAADANKA